MNWGNDFNNATLLDFAVGAELMHHLNDVPLQRALTDLTKIKHSQIFFWYLATVLIKELYFAFPIRMSSFGTKSEVGQKKFHCFNLKIGD